ncbi:Glycosyltransferases involved in cell wall biogenesis [Gordonia terrae C-6]|uniref:Glycosyltransferases involved in cell wall biogenesis n=1 Tax=Gordonia terrae C-6 TaxID=1316928 RepID=R7YFD9_9ACTN|nr:Glycosyltransferases involved in cell wall biogenesis [Gordonia terrae C-6]
MTTDYVHDAAGATAEPDPVPLDPAMPLEGAPEWPGATWVGMLDVAEITGDDREPDSVTDGMVTCAPLDAAGYGRARVLLRHGSAPIRFVDAPIVDGLVRVPVAPYALPDLPSRATLPPISVVVCTHERPGMLADALSSLQRLDYPDYEVVVVDNAPRTDGTRRVVDALDDPRFRLVTEPVAGLSNARNAGLLAAAHDLVAYTDDDVVADAGWLLGLAQGFGRSPEIACVCGMVPSGELRTRSQIYFDWRVSWADSMRARVFSLADPPSDLPLFPFQIGVYGTGANFAIRRDVALALGGFDEALGAGTRTRGGEDIDMFFRILTAGHALANEPDSIIWHRHRSTDEDLLEQSRGYGLGLGAWLTKVATERRHLALALRVLRRRSRAVARAGAAYGAITRPPEGIADGVAAQAGRREVLSVVGGPVALARERLRGRRARPLAKARS